ncbi:hypothetical protein COCVIDRAFT_22421 [Bipolaris victoriae FI3]|uniref:Uncharacterized protein n=1 Tax=Bipolaris victoriae (strain FI3) TaxID=930091 RepID=W7EUK7_BIPV3|nr:hypothetical protein COCVIDRAFT_22421 [Bipolaris victoriae FI3]
MTSLSVGQVSALIAAGTTSLQLLLPLAIPLILIAFINKRDDQVQQTAVTWSTLSRTLHSTYWPTILSSDSSASKNVNPAVVAAVYLGIFTTVLVAVTAVITPLGLYDAMLSSKPQRVPFSYAQDLTPFGYGSLPRNDMGFNRICGSPEGSMSCPGSNFSVFRELYTNFDNFTLNWSWTDGYYYTNISLETQNLWASGLDVMERSVSSMFDIQWRSYEIRQQNLSSMFTRYNDISSSTEKYYDNGSPYLVGGYRPIQGLLSSNGFKIIEGLVVDLERGGIGFRNHTIPPQISHEVTWTEDILFIVPETSCVDNNLTIDYDLKEDDTLHTLVSGGILRLTDRGGFADLNSTVNLEGIHTMNSSQDSIYLHTRALFAAGYSNALTMIYMNLTDKERGLKEFRMYEQAPVGTSYLLEDESNTTSFSGSGGKAANSSQNQGELLFIYTNPHNVTTDAFEYFEDVAQGRVDSWSLANISNIAIATGTFYPPPRPMGRDLNPFDLGKPGDAWTQRVYTCASASRATIKTVTFLYNGNGGLSDLRVINVTEKTYPNTSSMPIWGVEDSGITYRDIKPFWGLLSPKFAERSNISSIQRESLWLPGYTGRFLSSVVDSKMNTPGASFYSTIMQYIYAELFSDTALESVEIHDYSGYGQFALYQRWLELGRTATRSADIINLIWTDIAANAVVGTRSWLAKSPGSATSVSQDQNSPHEVPHVILMQRSTKYNIVYAVPVMLLLLLTLIISVATVILLLLQRTGLDRMRWFLNQTSLGRNLTALLYPDVSSQQSSQKTWAKNDAHRVITAAPDKPYAGNQVENETSPQSKEDMTVSQRLMNEGDNERLEQ